LDEIRRILRPGGMAVLQVHAFPYYLCRSVRFMARPLACAYYLRAILSGVFFVTTGHQLRHRWFHETAISRGRLAALCQRRGLRPVWQGGSLRKPMGAFIRESEPGQG